MTLQPTKEGQAAELHAGAYVSKADSLPRASEEVRRVADAGQLRYVRTTFLRE